MEINIKVSGIMDKCTDMVLIPGKTDLLIKVIICKGRNMEKGNLYFQMGISMTDIGKKASNMEKEF